MCAHLERAKANTQTLGELSPGPWFPLPVLQGGHWPLSSTSTVLPGTRATAQGPLLPLRPRSVAGSRSWGTDERRLFTVKLCLNTEERDELQKREHWNGLSAVCSPPQNRKCQSAFSRSVAWLTGNERLTHSCASKTPVASRN